MSDAVPILIAVEGVAIVVAVTGIVAYRVLPRDPDLHAPGDLKSSHSPPTRLRDEPSYQ